MGRHEKEELLTLRNPHALTLLARERGWRLELTKDEDELQAYRKGRKGKLLAVAPVSATIIESFIGYKPAQPKKPKPPRRRRAVAAKPLSVTQPFDTNGLLAEISEQDALAELS